MKLLLRYELSNFITDLGVIYEEPAMFLLLLWCVDVLFSGIICFNYFTISYGCFICLLKKVSHQHLSLIWNMQILAYMHNYILTKTSIFVSFIFPVLFTFISLKILTICSLAFQNVKLLLSFLLQKPAWFLLFLMSVDVLLFFGIMRN